MARILIVEGNARAGSERMIQLGGRPYGIAYAEVLESLAPGVECTVVQPSEAGPDCLPAGQSLRNYDGVAWTGSALNVYDCTEPIANQLKFADRVLEAGLPVFGSCWGLQLFTVALGGKVRKNPQGREIGIARDIALTEAGAQHPMYAGKERVFPALAVHMDEVEEMPSGAVILASNAVSDVQAMAVETGGVSFWGVQYHPEFDFGVMANVVTRNGPGLIEEGIAEDAEAVAEFITTFETLHRGETVEERGIAIGCSAPSVHDPALRRLELSNWLKALQSA